MEAVRDQKKSRSIWRARVSGLLVLPFVCFGAYWLGGFKR